MKYLCLYNNVKETLLNFRVERTAGRAVDLATFDVVRSKTVNLSDTVYITLSPIDLTSLKGLIHFDGDVKDWSESLNHGTATNLTYSDGIHEKWAIFNGTSSKVVFAHHSSNNFGTSDFSVFWEQKFTSTSLMPLIDKYGNSGWNISVENGKIKIYVKNAGGTQYTYTSVYAFNDGEWHHCTVKRVYNTGWYIYVDGVLKDTVTDGGVLPNNIDFNINTSLTLGHSPSLGGYYNDLFDETFWYTRAITDAEVSDEGSGLDHPVTIFGGQVMDREYKYDRISVKCEGFGKIIRDKFVEAKKYYNQTVEAIIEDLIETAGTGDIAQGTGFTYDSTWSSGITLKEYLAFGQMVDIITELSRSLSVDFHVTYNKLFHFEPNLNETIEWIAEVGDNVKSEGWSIKDNDIVNIVYLLGGAKRYTTQKSFTGDGSTTIYTLDFVPDVVEVKVAGVRKTPDIDYTVDPEGKKITFTAAPAAAASIVVDYEYDQPIFLKTQDSTSITQYGERARKFNADWINNIDDARRYANGLLTFYKQPRLMSRLTYTGLKADIFEMSVIRVVDDFATPIVDQTMDVKGIVWKYPEGITEIEVGTWTPRVFEWQKEIMLRIRDLERRAAAITELRRFLQLQEQFTLNDSVTVTAYSSGQFRISWGSDKVKLWIAMNEGSGSTSTDRSGNGHVATKNGSVTWGTGYYRYGWIFGGASGDYASVPYSSNWDIFNGDFTIYGRFKYTGGSGQRIAVATKNGGGEVGWAFGINASNVPIFIYNNGGGDTTLTGATTLVNGTVYSFVIYRSGTSLKMRVSDNLEGTFTVSGDLRRSSMPLIIGSLRSDSNNWTGMLDEIWIANVAVTDGEATNLHNTNTPVGQPAWIGVFDTNP